MVEWLAGNRLRGTTAERPALGLPSGSVGGWVELARTTLGSAGDTIDVSSLPDKRYLMYLLDNKSTGGNTNIKFTLNADTGSNYSRRQSTNGGTDSTGTSATNVNPTTVSGALERFCVGYFSNLNTKEKLSLCHSVGNQGGTGAGNDPDRSEYVWKHAQTTNPIDQFTVTNTSGGSYNTGSELVVLGWDPADSHTTNFWEELASVELGSSGDNLSSGTFTAKKYLWVQVFTKALGSIYQTMNFNNDAGSNYSERRSDNGGADGTKVNQSDLELGYASGAFNSFINMFIINNASNEKLVIANTLQASTAGAGTAPNRREYVGKWVNTSAQITEIDIDNSQAGSYDTGSIIKVWGSD